MKPHRVIFSTPGWHLSGVNTFTRHLIRGLTDKGVDARLVVTDPARDPEMQMPYPDGVPITELPVGPNEPPGTKCELMFRLLQDAAPCFFFPNYDYDISGISHALPQDVGVVGLLHSDDPEHYAHFRRLGESWDACVCVSEHITEQVRQSAPGFTSPLVHIPYGIPQDPEWQPAPVRPGGPLRIIYPQRLVEHQKRVLDLIPIVTALDVAAVPFELTIAGLGPAHDTLARALGRYTRDGRVRLLPPLMADELDDELRRQDTFLLTSEFEGLPLSLLEAMHRACVPVVSNVASGIPELLEDGVNGFVVDIGDTEAFADRLVRLHGDREQMHRMAAAARRTVFHRAFGAARMTRRYVELLDDLRQRIEAGKTPKRSGRISWRNNSWKSRVLRSMPVPLQSALRRGRRSVRRRGTGREPRLSAVLCTVWRSGSTHVGSVMSSNFDIRMADEPLWSRAHGCPAAKVFTGLSLINHMKGLTNERTNERGIFGAKLIWPHLEVALAGLHERGPWRGRSEMEIFEGLFPNPVFIHLRRRDRVAQAISLFRAESTKIWHMSKDGRSIGYVSARPTLDKVTYDRKAIEVRIERIRLAEEAWQAFFKAHTIAPIELVYEEVCEDLLGAVTSVMTRLGAAGMMSAGTRLQQPYRRMSDDTTAAWVARFREETAVADP